MKSFPLPGVVGVLLGAVVARADESTGDSIQLPWGTVVKTASFEAHPKWKALFPADHAFYADKYAEGNLHGMHSRYNGRLDGASVILHENGSLKSLAYFPGGKQEGGCHVWDEDKNKLLYAHFKDGKKDGITCLFRENIPWLVQQWSAGALQNQTLVARKRKDFVAVDDARELAEAQEKLSAIEKERTDADSELKNTVRSWHVDTKDRIDADKERAVRPALMARIGVDNQKARQERDARLGAARPYSRRGRAAAADEAMATRDLRAAKKNVNALAKDANRKLRTQNAVLRGESKEMYQLAMRTLEKISPDGQPAHAKEPHKKKGKNRRG